MSIPRPTPTETSTDTMSEAGTHPVAAAGPAAEPETVSAHDVRRLYRRADRRLLGGVCGGFADYSGADVALIRVLMVALTIFGGTGFALYAAAWLLVPVEGSTRSPAERLLGR